MSRIGSMPLPYEASVEVSESGGAVAVEGPQGKLEMKLPPRVSLEIDSDARIIKVASATPEKNDRAFQGLARSLLNNMVTGVVTPFTKRLEVNGVGYNAKLQGNKLVIQVGFCKPVDLDVPEGVEVDVPDPQHINLKSCDKQKVGQFAAMIRKTRPPDPYKAKGIRYMDEIVKRKPGKAFVSGGE